MREDNLDKTTLESEYDKGFRDALSEKPMETGNGSSYRAGYLHGRRIKKIGNKPKRKKDRYRY